MIAARPDLLDLRALAGSTWRIRLDAERLPFVVGRRGNVSAHDLTTLCVYVTGRYHLPKVLRALPEDWRRHQVGDHEANLLAPVGALDRACAAVKAYRRRRMTPESLEASRQNLARAAKARASRA
jgi:hypothetical protein